MKEKLFCLIISTFSLTFCQIALFFHLSEIRFDRKKSFIVSALYSTVVSLICIAAAYFNNCERSTTITMVCLAVPNLIFLYLISKYRDLRFFVTYGLSVLSLSLLDLFMYMAGLCLYDGNYTLDWIVRSFAVILWTVLLYFSSANRYRKALNLLRRGWGIMLFMVISMYGLMCTLSAYPTPIQYRTKDIPAALTATAIMQLFIIFMIQMLYNSLQIREQQLREQQLALELRAAEHEYALMSENYSQLRFLKHDMKYHMNMIYTMISERKYEEVQEYMEKYHDWFTSISSNRFFFTENQSVNILASYYANKAKESDIEVEMNINIPENLEMNKVYLTAFLGNMWQNALEACQVLPEDMKRYIRTSIRIMKDSLLVECINSSLPAIINKNGEFISTKGEKRGSGIESIRSIAGIFHGNCHFKQQEGEFIFQAILPLHGGNIERAGNSKNDN